MFHLDGVIANAWFQTDYQIAYIFRWKWSFNQYVTFVTLFRSPPPLWHFLLSVSDFFSLICLVKLNEFEWKYLLKHNIAARQNFLLPKRCFKNHKRPARHFFSDRPNASRYWDLEVFLPEFEIWCVENSNFLKSISNIDKITIIYISFFQNSNQTWIFIQSKICN